MTNTSVITYDLSIAGDSKYLPVKGYVIANPYQDVDFDDEVSFLAKIFHIEVSTGKPVKNTGDAEEIDNLGNPSADDDPVYYLANRSTIQSYSPGRAARRKSRRSQSPA